LRESFERACQRAGLEDFHWHDLRHCCASYLAQSQATDLEIAIQLGHSGTDLVKRYAHLREDNSLNLVEKIERRTGKL
jgi:integrase